MDTKSLSELVNEIRSSEMTKSQKEQALIKLGVSPYEAMVLAELKITVAPAHTFAYTFGVEIECEHCRYTEFFAAARANGLQVYDQVNYNHRDMQVYKLVTDGSLVGDHTAECVTPPLDNENGFASLQACCRALAEIGARANGSCGLHVHIGAADLTDQEYCNVFVNYMHLELAINTMLAPSRSTSHWCKSLRNKAEQVLAARTKHGMLQALDYDRYHRVNAKAYESHKTIEFRQHQGSTNYGKIAAWVKFLGKLVEYSKTNRLAQDIDRIEDIPFLTADEKRYFCERRTVLRHGA